MADEIKKDTVDYRDPTPFDDTKLNSISEISKGIRHKYFGKDTREALAQQGEALVKLMQGTGGNPNAEVVAARGNHELLQMREDSQDNAIINSRNEVTNYISQITAVPETFANLAAIKSKYPSGRNGLMVAADNGHKYIWNGTDWQDSGVYQAVGIGANSVGNVELRQAAVTPAKIDGVSVKSTHSVNRFDKDSALPGTVTASGFTSNKNWVRSDYIQVPTGAVVRINKAYLMYMAAFDRYGQIIKTYEYIQDAKAAEVKLADNVKYIMVNCFKDYINEFMITINDPMPASYQSFTGSVDSATIDWLNVADNSISPSKLNGTKVIQRRSVNRFNDQDVVDGQATINGIVSSDTWKRTDYLKVGPGDVITLSNVNSTIAVAYDVAKQPVKDFKYQSEYGQTSIIMPVDAYYVIINVRKDWTNFMFSINEPLPNTYEPFIKNDVVDVAWVAHSQFENKTAQMFGDSITWYDGHAQPDGTIAIGYESWLEELLGFNTVQNLGISGAPFATGKTSDNGIGAKIESSYQSTDLVLIAGGTNDFKLNVPLGEIQRIGGTFDKTTTAGALQSALEHIINTNNDQEILLMTPLQRNNSNYDIYSTNTAGFKLNDYRQLIIQLGELYSIPVFDGYANGGINLLNLNAYTLDGLHPNNAGFERISKSLATYIKANF